MSECVCVCVCVCGVDGWLRESEWVEWVSERVVERVSVWLGEGVDG